MKINLLPQDLKPKGYALKLSVILKKIATIAVVVFLVFSIAIVSSYFVIGNKLSSSVKKQEELKVRIKALEETEKKLVLIQDRLDKIKVIRDSNDISEEIILFEALLNNLQDGISLTSVDIKSSGVSARLNFRRSLDITRFLTKMIGNKDLNVINLDSFEYSNLSGYNLTLSLAK